jgi:long-chain acyl-CoA synthetase
MLFLKLRLEEVSHGINSIKTMDVTRTFDLLDRYKDNFPREDALCFKNKGVWIKYSARDYINYSNNFCSGLFEMGMRKGDKIMTVSSNRPEWNFVDMGMAMLGIVHVPVFTSLNTSEYEYILRDSEAKIVFVSDIKLFKSVESAVKSSGESVGIYSFDEIEGVANWMEIVKSGKSSSRATQNEINKEKTLVDPDTLATLIYTSGTTGKPKGVMLSQNNLVSNFISAASVFSLKPSDKYLSILPLCHVGGRMGNYQTQYSGAGIYYAESMGAIAANMQEIKPDGFDAVPRVLEKFYDVIISKGRKLTGIKRFIFFQAVEAGLKFKPFGENGWYYNQKLKLAERLVFSKWRSAMGGNIRIVGCGGASLNPRLERIFWAAGIKIINMYGLTETSPIITINRTFKGGVRLGSVGIVIDGVEVKIAEDGEILCKGPNVMLGYYNDPELTKSAIDNEGWFHTGDIGSMEDGRFLMVTDRKKEIFKLSNGKFIAHQLIENILKESSIIDQVMVVGENEKFASALISPNFRFFAEWLSQNKKPLPDKEELIRIPEVQEYFDSEIEKINKALSSFERISRFKLVPDEWSPSTGELSPTLKLRRHYISEKYSYLLDQIYIK